MLRISCEIKKEMWSKTRIRRRYLVPEGTLQWVIYKGGTRFGRVPTMLECFSGRRTGEVERFQGWVREGNGSE